YALELSGGIDEIEIVFAFSHGFPACSSRGFDFIIAGLRETEVHAEALGIKFSVLTGPCAHTSVADYAHAINAAAVVCDFNPMREGLEENLKLANALSKRVVEVDSRNIAPCRFISDKQEYGAFTIRKKIEKVLPLFLTPIPPVRDFLKSTRTVDTGIKPVDWDKIIKEYRPSNGSSAVEGFVSGSRRGLEILDEFISERLFSYADSRNDPNLNAQSGLSPYLHFGQISAQSAALAAARSFGDAPLKGGFLDEIIVRRELSDNYCLYNKDYDSFSGFPAWAKQSLEIHRYDRREFIYSLNQFENAETHDELWNAAQRQLLRQGSMHGYMRMYWAKKILEWSPDAESAMRTAVILNDRWSLDGHDTNGYAGCAWAIGGLHDRAWSERSVYGKVRYMNERGCRRKFDVDQYISRF
ncbi:MAG: deoxyribodipyrimidine photo-lyase, partial [Spirochaetales bacterium]|nr:deoxyribodipyrimidine photo-lyase [Spirochaetales bacterium]